MRAVVTRVSEAHVEIAGEVVGSIGVGLLTLVGVGSNDTESDARYVAQKVVGLRIFPDAAGAMNRSLSEVGGAVLAISQFTLFGDVRKGRRPSFSAAAEPGMGRHLYDHFVEELRRNGTTVATGQFGAMMEVVSSNAGPVTILIDSQRTF
ncbi:MAG: D-tyrosyl-tRNA(Tyr) deacylase [Candidatus Eremiobacteraeota bacterium]|nr:D-tyrosyl-tRNA(Tyr) deacylase [Candidatus Eremiobacteraeota bacterium]